MLSNKIKDSPVWYYLSISPMSGVMLVGRKSLYLYIALALLFILSGVYVLYMNQVIAEREREALQVKKEIAHMRAIQQLQSSVEKFTILISGIRAHIVLSDEMPGTYELQSFTNQALDKIAFKDSLVISYVNASHVFIYSFTRNSVNENDLSGVNVASIRDPEEIAFLENAMKDQELHFNYPINLVEGWLGMPIVFNVEKGGKSIGYIAAIIDMGTILDAIYQPKMNDDFVFKFTTDRGFDFDRRAIYDGSVIYNQENDPLFYKSYSNTDDFITSKVDIHGVGVQVGTAYKEAPTPNVYRVVFVFSWFLLIAAVLVYVVVNYRRMKRTRLKAEQASIAKANFLSMMSHEIRTPLNGIIGTTHLLLAKSPSHEQISHLKVLEQSSNNLMSIVNDILDFEKIEKGKVLIDQSAFSLNDLAESIYNNYKLQADEKGIDVRLDYDQHLSDYYLGDSVRISQILHNLMNNAVKFTHQGEVLLSIRMNNSVGDKDEIFFSVKDSGVGIPQEKHAEIFEVFTQVDKTTTRKYGGSGLGLTITKRILELMGSEIQLQSAEGMGSEFSFILHLTRTSSPTQGESKHVNDQVLEAKVLLVEDNAFNRVIARDFLESWGCSVLEAENGKEALEILSKNSVDIVLLDLQMPIMDGYETIAAIRGHHNNLINKLPVIALTADAMGDVEIKVLQSGMNGFISKPFHPTEFYQKVSKQLAVAE
ncbi:response regulator [Ekhidna sp.]|uniref:response regulator n=1 Tax=Ekhidna sp. TaxID=2608089 RepID=UPI0035190C41